MPLLLRRNEGAGREQEEGLGLADIIHLETEGQESGEPNGSQQIKANTEIENRAKQCIHTLVPNIKVYTPKNS